MLECNYIENWSRNSGGTAIYWSEAQPKYTSTYLHVQYSVNRLSPAWMMQLGLLVQSFILPLSGPMYNQLPPISLCAWLHVQDDTRLGQFVS